MRARPGGDGIVDRVDAPALHQEAAGRVGAPPIVLVHGIGSSSTYFRRLSAVLAARWRVVAVDLPGFGRTPGPRRALTVVEHAEVLGAFLEAHALDGAVLVGHSLGCQVVVDLLRAAPAAASRAVLIGPTVDDRARSAPRQGLRLARNALTEPKSLTPVQVANYLACGPRRYLGTVGPMLADHIEEALPHVVAPVLLVRGEKDGIAQRPWVRHLSTLAPRARVAEVAGARHVAQWSHPQAVADLCERGEAAGGPGARKVPAGEPPWCGGRALTGCTRRGGRCAACAAACRPSTTDVPAVVVAAVVVPA